MPSSRGLIALSAFFAAGAIAAGLTSVALLTPGGAIDPIWRLNPSAQAAFAHMGPRGSILMAVVALASGGAAVGLWRQARWGLVLALLLLGVNLVGNVINAFVRGDLRTLIGLPIAAVLIVYLLSPAVRRRFVAAK